MAKQRGLIKMEGLIDELSFYKWKGKYVVRRKGGASRDRIKNDPAFARTRENNMEFAWASGAAKLIRMSLNEIMGHDKWFLLHGRLTQMMLTVLRSNTTSDRGKRCFSNGDLSALQGFNFNAEADFNAIFYPKYTVSTNLESGIITATVEAFVPMLEVNSPEDATHIQLTLAGVEMDFKANEYRTNIERSHFIAMENERQEMIKITVTIPDNGGKIRLGVLALGFYQEVNGKMYVLKNMKYKALKIILAGQNWEDNR